VAGNSVWRVVFHLENTVNRVTSGPYTANIGIAAGSRGDLHSPGINASLVTAINNNLLSILQAQGFVGSAVPGGTVVIEHLSHAGSPDVWT